MDSCPPGSRGPSRNQACLFTCLALTALLLIVVSVPVRATPKLQTFHIDAGDAVRTLNEFSRQSSLQLLFDYNVVTGRRTHAVSGDLPAIVALQKMLEDTGLSFEYVNDRTLSIAAVNHDTGAGSAVAAAPAPDNGRTRAAVAQGVGRNESGSAVVRNDWRTAEPQEIVVTGTHLRGEQPVGDHVISADRDSIQTSGAPTAQDFLRTLPQTFGGGPSEDTHYFSSETQTNSGLGSGINLRGLGARATLVLVNGKRLAPSGSEAAFADIENIPLSAVERIDILPDSASAMYGADAVGGVVNFVMRDNFSGAESLARGGSGTRNTQREYQLAQTLGSHWDSGTGMLSVEYYRRDTLPTAARRYATSNLVPLGGSNFNTFLSNPGNIVIGNQTYAIPRGQNGTALTANELTPGTLNRSDLYTDADLLPSQRRLSLYGSGKQSLTDSLTLFGNAMVSQRDARQQLGGLQSRLTVPNTNPFYVNPTGSSDPLNIDYNFLDDTGPAFTDVLVNDLNLTLGVNVDLGAVWKLSLYGNYAQERENQLNGGQLNPTALAAALADPNPATAFNPFGDGSNTNPATLRTLVTGNRFYTDSRLRTADITVDGPIGRLPGGPIKLALGADHRNQVFDTITPVSPVAPASRAGLSRNVLAAFGELTVPLFGADNGHTGYRRLEFSVAGRYEHYSDFGQAATPKLGLVWAPFDTVAMRGTWGRSIRAPTLSDLDAGQNLVIATALPDETSAAGFSSVLIKSGKNPSLSVEHARNWTTGIDVDAREWANGLTFSVTYFNIDFRDRIENPAFGPDILDDPAFASLIARNPTAGELSTACNQGRYLSGTTTPCQLSNVGAIVDLRIQNMERVSTHGLDFNAAYTRSWAPGVLKLSLDGTWLFRFTQQEEPGAPARELLDTQNNPINLKMRGALSWQQRRWGGTVGINFQNHYVDTVSEPNRPISAYTTFDTQLRYELAPFGASFLANTRLELNAINVFNQSPPFLNNAIAQIGYDQENADPYGRLVSLQVRKTW
jgi:iron complex outermembrane receptor protein